MHSTRHSPFCHVQQEISRLPRQRSDGATTPTSPLRRKQRPNHPACPTRKDDVQTLSASDHEQNCRHRKQAPSAKEGNLAFSEWRYSWFGWLRKLPFSQESLENRHCALHLLSRSLSCRSRTRKAWIEGVEEPRWRGLHEQGRFATFLLKLHELTATYRTSYSTAVRFSGHHGRPGLRSMSKTLLYQTMLFLLSQKNLHSSAS